MNQDIHTFA